MKSFVFTLPLMMRFDPCAGAEGNIQASSPGSPPEMASIQVRGGVRCPAARPYAVLAAELHLVWCLYRLGRAAEKLADGVYELRAVVSVIQTAWAGWPH